MLFHTLYRTIKRKVRIVKPMFSRPHPGKTLEFNPYTVLDISPTATVHEIKAAYEREHKRLKPNEENWEDVKDQVKEIEKAYRMLKDDAIPHNR